VVFGGSWGSTLSLAYSQTHPSRCKALVLRGIFMCRREEIQFFYQDGSSWLFPDAFEKFSNHIPAVERGDLVGAYHRRVTSDDPEVRRARTGLFVSEHALACEGERGCLWARMGLSVGALSANRRPLCSPTRCWPPQCSGKPLAHHSCPPSHLARAAFPFAHTHVYGRFGWQPQCSGQGGR